MQREREFLETVVQLFVAECRSRSAFPRELFRTLLDWSDELVRASRLTEANDTCHLALALGVNAFPEIWPWIQLRIARAQMLLGNLEAAHTKLLETYRRLDRIADRNAVPALLDALGTVSLQTRRAPLFKRLLVERLRAFHTNGDERRAVVDLMLRANRGMLGLLASRETVGGGQAALADHWASLGAARRVGWRPVARLLEKCATGSAYVRQYGLRSARRPRIGDGAAGNRSDAGHTRHGRHRRLPDDDARSSRAEGQRARRPVVLAIPRRFFPLFEGNDDVELMDIDGDFDPAAMRSGST